VIRNFSWVIPGRLAGAALPGEQGPWTGGPADGPGLLSDLSELVRLGIRHLVSLTDCARGFGPLCRKAGLTWTYFPISDFGIPERTAQFDELIDSLTAEVASGRAVCAHCYAGIGRTGLLLTCVVGQYYDLDAARAAARVRAVRQALETTDQELFVKRYLESRA
jgi:protein-tyrosine phosphatase